MFHLLACLARFPALQFKHSNNKTFVSVQNGSLHVLIRSYKSHQITPGDVFRFQLFFIVTVGIIYEGTVPEISVICERNSPSYNNIWHVVPLEEWRGIGQPRRSVWLHVVRLHDKLLVKASDDDKIILHLQLPLLFIFGAYKWHGKVSHLSNFDRLLCNRFIHVNRLSSQFVFYDVSYRHAESTPSYGNIIVWWFSNKCGLLCLKQ